MISLSKIQMSQNAGMGIFPINRQMTSSDFFQYQLYNVSKYFRLQQAVLNGNHAMTSSRIKAANWHTIFIDSKWILCFVAVSAALVSAGNG